MGYDEFIAAETARGDLAFEPDQMPCYECGGFDGRTAPQRAVTGLAGTTRGADPSSLYRLECGHTAMAA
jgi:hypothetical protein